MKVTFNTLVPLEKLSEIPYLVNYIGSAFIQENDPIWIKKPPGHTSSTSLEVIEVEQNTPSLAQQHREKRKKL
jgi:hypothetical protein